MALWVPIFSTAAWKQRHPDASPEETRMTRVIRSPKKVKRRSRAGFHLRALAATPLEPVARLEPVDENRPRTRADRGPTPAVPAPGLRDPGVIVCADRALRAPPRTSASSRQASRSRRRRCRNCRSAPRRSRCRGRSTRPSRRLRSGRHGRRPSPCRCRSRYRLPSRGRRSAFRRHRRSHRNRGRGRSGRRRSRGFPTGPEPKPAMRIFPSPCRRRARGESCGGGQGGAGLSQNQLETPSR